MALDAPYEGGLLTAGDKQGLLLWDRDNRQAVFIWFGGNPENPVLEAMDAFVYSAEDQVAFSGGSFSVQTTQEGAEEVYAGLSARCAERFGPGRDVSGLGSLANLFGVGMGYSLSRIQLYTQKDQSGTDYIIHCLMEMDHGINALFIRNFIL